MNYAVIYLPDSDLPEWQQAILIVVGLAIAYGILYGLYLLIQIPKARRVRKRAAAVEAAAGGHPVFGAATVKAAAAGLFGEMQAALDAGDLNRLARISDTDFVSYWESRLAGYHAEGSRYRVRVLRGPDIRYIGLHDDPDDSRDYVRLQVVAKLHRFLEQPNGARKLISNERGTAQKMTVTEYWTLSRRNGWWIIYMTRVESFGKEYLAEQITGPLPA